MCQSNVATMMKVLLVVLVMSWIVTAHVNDRSGFAVRLKLESQDALKCFISSPPLEETIEDDEMACAKRCVLHTVCTGFNWAAAPRSCQLMDSTNLETLVTTESGKYRAR